MLVSLIMLALSAVLPVCQTEDSTNCVWDASEHGNGIGNDVAVVTASPNYSVWFIARPDGSTAIHVTENDE